MVKLVKVAVALVASLVLISCSQQGDLSKESAATITQLGIKDLRPQEWGHYSAGQPSQEQFARLAELGVKHVITLRPAKELDWNEEELVASLGMRFYSIPIGAKADISLENAKKISDLLDSLKGQATLLHCNSSNRVGAMIALAEGLGDNVDIEAAVNKGKSWGLGSIEPVVRMVLSSKAQ